MEKKTTVRSHLNNLPWRAFIKVEALGHEWGYRIFCETLSTKVTDDDNWDNEKSILCSHNIMIITRGEDLESCYFKV